MNSNNQSIVVDSAMFSKSDDDWTRSMTIDLSAGRMAHFSDDFVVDDDDVVAAVVVVDSINVDLHDLNLNYYLALLNSAVYHN